MEEKESETANPFCNFVPHMISEKLTATLFKV